MSSGRGNGYPLGAYASDPSVKGKSTAGVSDMNVNPVQDDGWEEIGKKSKNKNKANAPRQWGAQAQQSNPKAWGHADTVQKLGLRTDGGLGRGYNQTGPALSSDARKFGGRGYTNQNPNSAPAVIPPPLKNGWGWSSRAASSQPSVVGVVYKGNSQAADSQASKGDRVDDGDDSDDSDDTNEWDDDQMSDESDSDEGPKSHEIRKENKWFKELFDEMDKLTVDQINEPERQWHCPACKGGPGAIDWYRGMLPLISHAKTKKAKRMKLHKELGELLDEELRRRGTSAVPAGEMFGKWKGLDERKDKQILWPPMVIIMNTRLDKDDNDKWIGMGNQELLEYFSGYSAVKARHSYGPQGHRGMSVLIFEASAVGYAEADRLSKHFEDTNQDRMAWQRNRVPFYPGGRRQLFGYMAVKDDIDYFNQHSQGKSKMKYEMKSYQEMVVKQLKKMSEDNQQLLWFKNKAAKEQMNKKALEETLDVMSEKLRKTTVENQVVKLRTKRHHEQNKEEMDSQEQFFKENIQQLYDARNAKEENFEKIQQQEREKVIQSDANGSAAGHRVEDISSFIKLQDKQLEEYNTKRDELLQALEERRLELLRKHNAEKLALEKEFDEEFNKLRDEYTPTESK